MTPSERWKQQDDVRRAKIDRLAPMWLQRGVVSFDEIQRMRAATTQADLIWMADRLDLAASRMTCWQLLRGHSRRWWRKEYERLLEEAAR
jgi:hypothetical protein